MGRRSLLILTLIPSPLFARTHGRKSKRWREGKRERWRGAENTRSLYIFLDRQGHNSRMNQCFLDRTGPHHPSAFFLPPWHRLCRPLSRPPPRRAIRVERAEQPSGLNLHQRIYRPHLYQEPPVLEPLSLLHLPSLQLILGQLSLASSLGYYLSLRLCSFPRLRGRTLCSQLLGKGSLPLHAHTPRRQGVVASAR